MGELQYTNKLLKILNPQLPKYIIFIDITVIAYYNLPENSATPPFGIVDSTATPCS